MAPVSREIVVAARGVVLSAIEEQIILLLHDQPIRLHDPGDYTQQFVETLLDIRTSLGRSWEWPDPRLPRWFEESLDD
jgi:hypothetical protein